MPRFILRFFVSCEIIFADRGKSAKFAKIRNRKFFMPQLIKLRWPMTKSLKWQYMAIHGQFKNWFMLSVRISSYGCTREVWRARKKRKSCSRRSREQL